jgi:predicted RNase H-like nuclease (RuvC/YqgF family)
MGKKGKKGGSADKKAKTPSDGRPSTGQQIEYLEVKISDLNDRYTRYKAKCELLQRENEILGKSQARFTDDKEDIVEFLGLKVGEHEKLISALESKIKRLEEENQVLNSKAQVEIDAITRTTTEEISTLSAQTTKYKGELNELTKFAENKVRLII